MMYIGLLISIGSTLLSGALLDFSASILGCIYYKVLNAFVSQTSVARVWVRYYSYCKLIGILYNHSLFVFGSVTNNTFSSCPNCQPEEPPFSYHRAGNVCTFSLLYPGCYATIFGYAPCMQSSAKNIIKYDICIAFCDLHRHETLPIIIQFQFFPVPRLDIACPCLRSTSTCYKVNSTGFFYANQRSLNFRTVIMLMLKLVKTIQE